MIIKEYKHIETLPWHIGYSLNGGDTQWFRGKQLRFKKYIKKLLEDVGYSFINEDLENEFTKDLIKRMKYIVSL